MIRVECELGKPPYDDNVIQKFIRIKDILCCYKIHAYDPQYAIYRTSHYPYYQIIVKNHDIDRSPQTYILHVSENERMTRIINGTDGTMAELVDELKNHPSIGVYPKMAAEDFL